MLSRLRIGMRLWLALAFGAIGFVTAATVWQVLSDRAERAFRDHAANIALGNATAASAAIERAVRRGDLAEAVPVIATRRGVALFVFDSQGNLLTPERTRRTDVGAIPGRSEAIEAALAGETFVSSSEEGESSVVAIPLRTPVGGALLAYAPRPELAAGLGIAREKIAETALLAVAIGGAAGLVVAVLITARLRRINAAAAAIEAGDFDIEIRPGFRDELGELAVSVDRMRRQLKESFAALAGERDRLHLLLERLQEGVFTVDSDLRVEYANSTARAVLGLEAAEGLTLPEPWRDLSLRSFAASLFDGSADVRRERAEPDDEHVYSVAGIGAGSELAVAVIVIRDESERERRERSQREFVANAAHELRTPLSVISGAIEMLQAGAKDVPEERDRFLDHIGRESARLGRLARVLLALARSETRAEPLRLEPVDLRSLLQGVAATLRTRPDVTVEVRCGPGLVAVAQADLAEQIVSNLADNAAKHTEVGRIVLAARAAGPAQVEIEVSDTGAGIDPADQEAVFERFYRGAGTRGPEGFGLGLAIVRQAVAALGGELDLESAPGTGTTVRIVLPRADAAAAPGGIAVVAGGDTA